jgi:transcriptional regulator with XRE-family HTH domain
VQPASPTVSRWELANRLRALRASKGLSIEQVAEALLCSPSKISRIEKNVRPPSARDVRDLSRIYEVPDDISRELMELLRESKQRAWWQNYDELPSATSTYIGLEQAATEISWYETIRIPGLLQTPDYTRALLRSLIPSMGAEAIDHYVELRGERQSHLITKPQLRLWAILDQATVTRQVGGPKVLYDQVQRLIEVAQQLPNVTLQLVPFSAGGHAGMDGSFSILTFPPGSLGDVIYIENRTGHLFLSRESDLKVFREVLNYLRATAANPDESLDLLEQIAQTIVL